MSGRRTSSPKKSGAQQNLSLRLYVAGDAPNSVLARANLSAALDRARSVADISIVDVFDEPTMAFEDRVFVTPMLLKLSPLPQCRIVGTLNDREALLHLLGIASGPPGS